ncbi:MAG: hypothetical protein ACYC2G_14685 [Gemmatimonadaceae bacterium]
MKAVAAGPATPGALYCDDIGCRDSRARGVVLYLEDGGELGPCMAERLALAQRDAGLLVAPVITARPAGEDETGATPDFLAHRDRLEDALIETAEHVAATAAGHGLPLVVIAGGVAAASALRAAARCPTYFAALMLVDGRVDLADSVLTAVRAPILLLADGRQPSLVAINRLALSRLHTVARLVVLSPRDDASTNSRDLCGTVLRTMRRWLATLPAFNTGRTAVPWTATTILRAAAARLRRTISASTGDPNPGDASSPQLRPAIW